MAIHNIFNFYSFSHNINIFKVVLIKIVPKVNYIIKIIINY